MDEQSATDIPEFLVADDQSNEYPYLTALLLFRAGRHQEAVWYLSNSSLEHARQFGDEIYGKYLGTFGCRLPQEEIQGVMATAQQIAP